ncbi:hypothetical protein BSKO_13360 [Bryopsis sp. KO-2023]|nr:hypothetical protein BSKO_13360 [Bryopsis sp. KO-2023]
MGCGAWRVSRLAFGNSRPGLVPGKRRHFRLNFGSTSRPDVGHLPRWRCLVKRTPARRKPRTARAKKLATNCCSSDAVPLGPVSVMLDSNVITQLNVLEDPLTLKRGLKSLRGCGVTSIAINVWWGVVENNAPGVYEWDTYRTPFRLIKDFGFEIKAILCFHGNGKISLPSWVLEEGIANPNVFFTDKTGEVYRDCLSLGVDCVPALRGRTGVGVYADFMASFLNEFSNIMGSCITEVVVGLGPDGELKYPSHPKDARWRCPGIGEFQSYDCYMQSTLKACAERSGHWDWGVQGGPLDAGDYTSEPEESSFFNAEGGWKSPYGKFFLQWYASQLLRHGHLVLDSAVRLFSHHHVTVGAKIPMIHWWQNQPSHPPELTAGIYHTTDRDGYVPILSMLSEMGVSIHVSGGELSNASQPENFDSNPEATLAHLRACAAAFRVPFTIQNLTVMDEKASWDRIRKLMFEEDSCGSISLPQISSLMINYLCDEALHPTFWDEFRSFLLEVNGKCSTDWDESDGEGSFNRCPSSLSLSEDFCREPFCVT